MLFKNPETQGRNSGNSTFNRRAFGQRADHRVRRTVASGEKALYRAIGLGGVGDVGDDEAVGADAIEDGIRSAADYEFTDAGFRADAAEIGMNSQSFNDGNDAGGWAFGGVWLVQGDKGANFLEAGQSQGRPDDL